MHVSFIRNGAGFQQGEKKSFTIVLKKMTYQNVTIEAIVVISEICMGLYVSSSTVSSL